LIWLFGTLSRADTISRAYLAKNEREVYKAVLFATPMIMASGIMFFFIGILGAGLLPNLDGLEAENTFLIMAQDWAPGIITGLAFAGLLATAQSTISGQLMVSSMAVSRDIYARVLFPRLRGNAVAPDERHILSVARYSMVFMGLIAAALAVVRPTFIIQIITLAVAIMGPGFLVTFLAGFFWRRATKTGAIIALVLGVTSATYLSFYPITVPGAPWLVAPLMSIVITGVGMVVGSLVSQPPSEGAIEVYERLRRRSPATSAASGSTESNARELERD
jgi:Na+/proline symporter